MRVFPNVLQNFCLGREVIAAFLLKEEERKVWTSQEKIPMKDWGP
ncbi:hypothetical protein DB44_BG00790 [Candidatus Protochlamydia amoebophila]|uniref:Uncharacterized protein n=1 Tax=Candidatus Protochlamydia amoebophila TaxID=362787 RepID=A0A0C1JQ76_9BACT|nr:hypothetical protein DB44_BG00790 [Candidatus Protochlamydia amoebophila]